jgi:hypothetical protein
MHTPHPGAFLSLTHAISARRLLLLHVKHYTVYHISRIGQAPQGPFSHAFGRRKAATSGPTRPDPIRPVRHIACSDNSLRKRGRTLASAWAAEGPRLRWHGGFAPSPDYNGFDLLSSLA